MKLDCSMLLSLHVNGTPHLQKRFLFSSLDMYCFLNGVEATLKRKHLVFELGNEFI